MVEVKISEVLQNLRQSMWDYEIVYADRSLKVEQILIKPLL
jgi:hypothetical protein